MLCIPAGMLRTAVPINFCLSYDSCKNISQKTKKDTEIRLRTAVYASSSIWRFTSSVKSPFFASNSS